MELTLSHNCVLHTDLLSPDGQSLYTISTPRRFPRKATTITKAVLDDKGRPTGESEELATIHWHCFRNSQLVYNDKITDINDFMPSQGMFRRTRCLTAPDGKSYRWKMGCHTSHLEVDEVTGEHSVVARMRQRNILRGTKPVLEIDELSVDLLDLVVVTWVFVEQKRRDRQHHQHL
ncbi:hypothetical protein PsYK624_041780 [Phanerochaete sordida]|uniref:DUF6593 domain-containing protein n=1 Tax=Phanerochaete sordida TaxID=48140 RepID=A0A9P3G5U2_9APHY|nr:hypothetical protein PsYK624_041780 [Phanerochaete sordida]